MQRQLLEAKKENNAAGLKPELAEEEEDSAGLVACVNVLLGEQHLSRYLRFPYANQTYI